jgi:hypothetical protein
MGWNPFKKSSWTKLGDDIVDTANDVADTVTDTATAKAVAHTTQTCTSQASEYAKQGFDVASTEWKIYREEWY